jgi:hypothetical protein
MKRMNFFKKLIILKIILILFIELTKVNLKENKFNDLYLKRIFKIE